MALHRQRTGWNWWSLTDNRGYYFWAIELDTVLLVVEDYTDDDVICRALGEARRRLLRWGWTVTDSGHEDGCMFIRYERVESSDW